MLMVFCRMAKNNKKKSLLGTIVIDVWLALNRMNMFGVEKRDEDDLMEQQINNHIGMRITGVR